MNNKTIKLNIGDVIYCVDNDDFENPITKLVVSEIEKPCNNLSRVYFNNVNNKYDHSFLINANCIINCVGKYSSYFKTFDEARDYVYELIHDKILKLEKVKNQLFEKTHNFVHDITEEVYFNNTQS